MMAFFKTKEEIAKEKAVKAEKVMKEPKAEKKVVSKKPAVKKPKTVKKDKRDVPSKKPKKTTVADLSWVLLSPRITEKSAYQSENKVYVFNVHKDANKNLVKEAIAKKFDVVALKVNIVKVNSKPVTRRGIKGRKPEGKKAYVYLSKKDTIQFV
jgi:large subunit ribosomal protein L23